MRLQRIPRHRVCGLVLSGLLLLSLPSQACSIFMGVGDDGSVLAGNNEDFYMDVSPLVWVAPASKGMHGRVCFGFKDETPGPFAQGGLNDAGLFFDAAVTPPGETKRIDGKKKAPENMGDRMLAKCASVVAALEWLGRYDLALLDGGHMLLADASGDGAVVELDAGEMKVFRRKTSNYVGATNFAFAAPGRGNYPCPRFKRIDDYFKVEHGPVTVEAFRDLLASVAVPRTHVDTEDRDGGTLYSNVCDLKNGLIYLYRESAFDRPARLELSQLLAKGEKTYRLAELF